MNTVRMQMIVIIFTILTVGLCQLFGQKAKPQWFDEEMGTIRTATVKMATNQDSRVGRMRPGAGWNYDADGGDTACFFDGSLFLGKDSLSLSTALFADTTSSGAGSHGDTLLGRLFCLSGLEIDSTSIPSYRHSHGIGCNKDSTIEFESDFYAPRHIDSSNFMIGKFSFYAGPKDPGATINDVMVAYSLDMNIPDDSADNIGGADPALQMVYQAGKWGSSTSRYGAIAGLRDDGSPLVGGTVVMNSRSIERLQGYVTDSAWTWLKGINSFTGTDSVGDLHSILLFSRTATITPKAQGMFTIWVVFAGQPKAGGSLNGLKAEIAKAKSFICRNLNPDPAWCYVPCTDCGNANSDGAFNISDAVYIIAYIFAGGSAPGSCGDNPIGSGNADGCGIVTISDVYAMQRKLFCSGPWPSDCENTLPCPKTVRGVIRVGNPPYSSSGVNTVEIPIYITTDFPLAALSLGFTCHSDNIELTSIDWYGSQVGLAKSTGGTLQNGSQILDFRILPCGDAETHNNAFLFRVNARILQGCPYQAFSLDSSFVPPGGEFVLIGENGEQYSPEFIPNDAICTGCGDANGDCAINISDAVWMICYIFIGICPFPGDCNYPEGLGDANGDGVFNISDAVYIIAYVFAGGTAPHCQGM